MGWDPVFTIIVFLFLSGCSDFSTPVVHVLSESDSENPNPESFQFQPFFDRENRDRGGGGALGL